MRARNTGGGAVIDGRDILVRVEHIFSEANAGILDRILCDKAIACLTDLFGEPPVLFKEKVNYKLPGCRADKFHQDQAAGWNTFGDFFISMAVAVDENRLDNAALTFLSSGNYEKALMTPEWQPLTDQDPPFSAAGDYQLMEANPGDVIFFDSYVPHGSPANLSTRSRRNLFLTFNRRSEGDHRERYYREKWASYPPNVGEAARPASSFRV